MSWFTSKEITCPACTSSFTGTIAESVNVVRTPEARRQVLEGSFHVAVCPTCAQAITLDTTFLYSDFSRRQFVQVFASNRRAEWQRCEQIAGEVFSQGFEGAPPFVGDLARGASVRAVFGMAYLAEKLRLWDAGLDDGLVELIKLELLTSGTGASLQDGADVLLTSSTIDGLEFMVRARDVGVHDDVEMYRVERNRYRQLADRRDELVEQWPGLFHMPYVSYRRLAREPALTSPSGQELDE